MLEATYRQAARLLRDAEALILLAGAGIGVDSGLPDFRGNQGFWKAYPPIAQLGLSFQKMAQPQWFHSDPRLAWGFYGHRLNLYRSTTPHAGFRRLQAIGRERPAGSFVFTSNVDGQFQKAGFDPFKLVECHGSIHHFQCSLPCSDDIWNADPPEAIRVEEKTLRAAGPLPRCPRCGATARPNILMFGDGAWLADRSAEQARRLAAWLETLRRRRASAVIVEVGAGATVPTVRREAAHISQLLGAPLLRINPREAEVPTGKGLSLGVGCLEGVTGIWRRYAQG